MQQNDNYENDDEPQMETQGPSVSASSTKIFMGIVIVAALVAFLWITVFSSGSEQKEVKKEDKPVVQISRGDSGIVTPPIPGPAVAPPVVLTPPVPTANNGNNAGDGSVPPPPPPPPPLPQGFSTGFGGGAAGGVAAPSKPTNQERQRRIESAMIFGSGGTGGGAAAALAERADDLLEKSHNWFWPSQDPNMAYAQSVAGSKAANTEATIVKNLDRTIVQGRIVEAVLETAINTDLPGLLRAVISRDVYPESGRTPIITKGSRMIGNYSVQILRGQKRVFVIWTRVIRPDGVDIDISSISADALGRGGVPGEVDNKYMEVFTGAMLTSAITVGVAIGSEKLVDDPSVTTTTNSNGNTTSQSSASAEAVREATSNIGQTARGVIDELVDVRPTITVPQGARINILVNRDIIFPSSTLQTRFVE